MAIGLLTLHIHLPGCSSLKEKRRRLKPLLTRLHREFNLSVAEVKEMDVWQDAILQCALVSNNNIHVQRSLQTVVHWIETFWPDVTLVDQQLEIL
jgi:uncharacterized protein